MTVNRPKSVEAFTLIETMVAMVVLAIAALGALGYQYHAALQVRIAHAQTTGTRTAQLLLEDWKSTGGSEDYDPIALAMGFSNPFKIPTGHGLSLPDEVCGITVDASSG